ncbi:hypothetical protein TRFO_04160 [Tritrichomonas foetus]|uniref:USP domain-containing protein n=1 Tax=Tritrichomonas foetus TaxID=1144522 RepID=A0A1J4KHY7_9EUKA|nr:hypothetical protein TRFO_04160 [Tritrichomonas foetus]|eukprot:OHT10658.1 hypothetical protein TRFO_04160 [Tritrichomonas foetus]
MFISHDSFLDFKQRTENITLNDTQLLPDLLEEGIDALEEYLSNFKQNKFVDETNEFLTQILYPFTLKLLSLVDISSFDSMTILGFLLKVLKDLFPFLTMKNDVMLDIIVSISNPNNYFYRNKINFKKTLSQNIIHCIFDNDCLNTLLHNISQFDFIQDKKYYDFVFYFIDKNFDQIAGVTFKMIRVSMLKAVNHIYESLKSVDIHKIDPKTMSCIMSAAYKISRSDKNHECIMKIFDISFFLLKCDILGLQVIGVSIFNDAASHLAFVKWAKSNKFLHFYFSQNFHDEIMKRSMKFIVTYITNNGLDMDTLDLMINHLPKYEPSHIPKYNHYLKIAISKLEFEEILSFVERNMKVDSSIIQFFCTFTASKFKELPLKIANILISYRTDLESCTIIDQNIVSFCKFETQFNVKKFLYQFYMEKFCKGEVTEYIINILNCLIKNMSCSDLFNNQAFIQALVNNNPNEMLINLLENFIIYVSKEINPQNMKSILKFMNSNKTLIWVKLEKIIGLINLNKELIIEIWELIDSNITESSVNKEFIDFLVAFTIKLNGCQHGFDSLLRAYNNSQNIELVEYLKINILYLTYRFLSLPESFARKILNINDQKRALDLIYSMYSIVYEPCINENIQRHHISSYKNYAFIKLLLSTTGNDPQFIKTYISLDWPAFALYKLASLKLRISVKGLELSKNKQIIEESIKPISTYGIINDSIIGVSVTNDIPQSNTYFPSQESQWLTQNLIEILKNHTKSHEIKKFAWKLAKFLKTDENLIKLSDIVLSQYIVENNLELTNENSYILNYIFCILINRRLPIENIDFYISLLLDNQENTPPECIKYILSLIYSSKYKFTRANGFLTYLYRLAIDSKGKSLIQFLIGKLIKRRMSKESKEFINDFFLESYHYLSIPFIEFNEHSKYFVNMFRHFEDSIKPKIFAVLCSSFNQIPTQNFEFFFQALLLCDNNNCDICEIVGNILSNQINRHSASFLISIIPNHKNIISMYGNITGKVIEYALTQGNEKELEKYLDFCSLLLSEDQNQLTYMKEVLLQLFDVKLDEWSLDFEQGQNCPFVGLKNPGVICYFNSVVQQLYHNINFRNIILSLNFSQMNSPNNSAENDDAKNNSKKSNVAWLKELQRLFVCLSINPLQSVEAESLLIQLNFTDNLRQQQDALEVFLYILDKSPENIKNLYRGSFLHTFSGITEEYESKNEETFISLSLQVRGQISFENSFRLSLAEEKFIGKDKYFAESLGRKIEAKKSSCIKSAGDYLVIQLRRFEYDIKSFTKYKIDDKFVFPDEFDLTPYTENPNGPKQIYELTGVIVHSGTTEVGHYVSCVKQNNKWYEINDQFSSFLNNKESIFYGGNIQFMAHDDFTTNPSAYILFYKRVNSQNFTENNSSFKLCETMKEKIDEKNANYRKLFCLFSNYTINFIKNLNDTDIIIPYFLKIGSHSPPKNNIIDLIQGIGKITNGFIRVDQIFSLFNDIVNLFTYCTCSNYISIFSVLLYGVFNSCQAEATYDFSKKILEKLFSLGNHWDRIQYFSLILHVAANRADVIGLMKQNKFGQKICDFLRVFYDTNKLNSIAVRDVDLKLLFLVLSKLGFDPQPLLELSPLILKSRNCKSQFLELMTEVIPIKDLIQMLPNTVTFEKNFFISMLKSVQTDEEAECLINMARSKQFNDEQIVNAISIEMNNANNCELILDKMKQFPKYLFFDFLVSSDAQSRRIMENIFFQKMFPSFKPPFYRYAEQCMTQRQCNSPLEKSSIFQTKVNLSNELIYEILDTICSEAIEYIETLKDISSSDCYTPLMRIFNIKASNITISDEHLNKLFLFTQKVNIKDQELKHQCNLTLMEFLRILENIETPQRNIFLKNNSHTMWNLCFDSIPILYTNINYNEHEYIFNYPYPIFYIIILMLFLKLNKDRLADFIDDVILNKEKIIELFLLTVNVADQDTFKAFMRAIEPTVPFLRSILIEIFEYDGNISSVMRFVNSIYLDDSNIDQNSKYYIEKMLSWLMRQVSQPHFIMYHDYSTKIFLNLIRKNSNIEIDCDFAISSIESCIQYSITHNDDCRKGFNEILYYIIERNATCALVTIDYLTTILSPDNFWIVFWHFTKCYLCINDTDTRKQYAADFFSQVLDNIENINCVEAFESFSLMTQILEKFGFEENSEWATFLYILLMEKKIENKEILEFVTLTLCLIPDDLLIDGFVQQVQIFDSSEGEEKKIAEENARLFYSARPEMQEILHQHDDVKDILEKGELIL